MAISGLDWDSTGSEEQKSAAISIAAWPLVDTQGEWTKFYG